ncbi:molybdenum cofactor guanylyltransferase [Tissierella praeacuta]|uniref:molybdenum cofactor guanylyltransferase n=1 Tax=Tissierella praeacuta TaxID=43131 RepID=UPI0028ADC6EA|nr:molybdenum cofactor guanylyltransferase [Tissierella praeacuta]
MNKFNTAVILAGGKSSRMGFDKQFLEFNNHRLMKILIESLRKEFSEIIIVTNKPDEYKGFDSKIITDVIQGKGPLSGIHAGLKESSSKYIFVIACDMPNINLDYIKYMKRILEDTNVDICVTQKENRIEPFNGFYSREIIEKIEEHLSSNKRSVNELIFNSKTYFIKEKEARIFSPDWDMFSNLNTKEDLESFLSHNTKRKKLE